LVFISAWVLGTEPQEARASGVARSPMMAMVDRVVMVVLILMKMADKGR
jgi:hypothetical protein